MPALALTDHLGLTGSLSFYRACRESGVKPILGLEIDLLLPYHLSSVSNPDLAGKLVLLASDLAGWRNLLRLSSSLQMASEHDKLVPCSLDQLNTCSAGLLCLTGGSTGGLQRLFDQPDAREEACKFINLLRDIFPDRLYIELHRLSTQDDIWNEQLTSISKLAKVPTVAAHPVYYLEAEHAQLQKTISAIRLNVPLKRLRSNDVAPAGSYFIHSEEMSARFVQHPAALDAVNEIVERCQFDLSLGQACYPQVPLPQGMSAISLLRQKAEEGARKLYPVQTPELRVRLEYELSAIEARGYEPIFLIAEEMIAFARKNGIPSASRGSASSSLVAHCTGITTPDPLELDLYFERFLNPARATPPDIDTDFCSRRRMDVIHHLFETYGADRVAMVGTVNTFRPRSALGDVAKAHGLKLLELRALTSKLSHRFYRPSTEAAQPDHQAESPYVELLSRYGTDPRYTRIFNEATALIGLPHHLSVHPGGVVIAPGPLVDFVPVARSGGSGVTITQFDLDDVEQVGLVKLDVLGIRGLTVLGDVMESIYSWRRKEFNTPYQVFDSIPQNDPETSSLISSGRTVGCFQIESPGMRATLKDIHASSPADLMAALALYRPGPLKGGLRDAFVRRHKKEETVTHIHPTLSSLLNETHGVILYQEQVLRIAHELAGFSLAEADILRRAMSHFDPGRQMLILQEKFVTGAEKKSRIPVETGERIWEMMAAFAGYGFPKAHAASYAQVAWRSAWCKAHYPAEFIAAVLANWGGYYPQSVYLNEARRLKINVFPPHINHSRRQFSVNYPKGETALYMGLDQVRDLTRRTQERILRFRPFQNLTEFLMKVDPRRQEAENLIQVGALDGLGLIPDLLRDLSGGTNRPGQLSLFSLTPDMEYDWSLEQKYAAQQRLLGVGLSIHPLDLFSSQIQKSGAISTVEATTRIGDTIRVVGLRQTLFRSLTAQGEWMAFLTIEDFDGMLDIVLFPDIYRQVRNNLSGNSIPLLIEGTVDRDANTGEPILVAQKVWRLDS